MPNFPSSAHYVRGVHARRKTKTNSMFASLFLTFLLLVAYGTVHAQSTYHSSPGGDDRNDGKSPATAWRTVARVNSQSIHPGDHILFKRGGEWRECLIPNS